MYVRGISLEKVRGKFFLRQHVNTAYGHASSRFTEVSQSAAMERFQLCMMSLQVDHATRQTD